MTDYVTDVPKRAVLLQLIRFGGVGIAATLVHTVSYVGLIEFLLVAPLLANLIAFVVAVAVSYLGHSRWTFATDATAYQAQKSPARFTKFVATTISGLLLNSLVVYLVTEVWRQHYGWSVVGMLTLVPAAIFVLNKYWVFAR